MCLRKMCLMVWKRTFYGNVDLSTTCQCWQLRLNLLSTQINIYCLMTNQTPALLVQRAPWTEAAVMLLQSLYFSCPSPRAIIIPDFRPISTVENQDTCDGKTGYLNDLTKIGDCEQSIVNFNCIIYNQVMWDYMRSHFAVFITLH